ncbi:MAG: GGDEF domain-containing protein [Pseudobutyrivibrio sp.]|nr:GGDEF domain-containing protein [Pseudobutyrivibrio sp.]
MNKNILLESKKEYLLENFERALNEDWIDVYIQPVVRSSNGRVCEEEALARWDDPVLGVLNPNDIVPVLEEAGLIAKLDLYILEKVIEKMKRQIEMGLYIVPTSINFSQLDFQSGSVVKKIDEIISASGISKNIFSFEISENSSLTEKDKTICQLERLQKLGYGIEFDDFGSGDSSLLLANQIHFNSAKINLSLTRQILVNSNAKILVTELVKMARALDIEIIVKGVEDKEQVDFLREIGCAKLQGFYFSKPIAVKDLEKFAENDKQFLKMENPKEAEYYNTVDRVSLHEMSYVNESIEGTAVENGIIPMAIMEIDEYELSMMRLNKECQVFIDKNFPNCADKNRVVLSAQEEFPGAYTVSAIKKSLKSGGNIIIDDRTPIGQTVHLMIKKIATNPETNKTAVIIAVISVGEKEKTIDSLSYNYISRALSEDYIAMYFVNIETNAYVEYKSDGLNRDVTIEYSGTDFFEDSHVNKNHKIYEEDQQMFNEIVTKENIIKNIEDHGSFSLTYRVNAGSTPRYVRLKAVKDRRDGKHFIIGVNSVDNQIKQQERFVAMQEERIYYSRIASLVGAFYAVYCVDLNDNSYTIYKTQSGDNYISTNRKGLDFFEETRRLVKEIIYPDDLKGFYKAIVKEKILDTIAKKGSFEYEYRLMIEGKPRFFRYKAIIIKENEEEKLIVGLIDIDDEVRKEKEYVENLSMVEDMAMKDELTGVKNKHAYARAEERLEVQIAAGTLREYAIAVFDLNGLKYVNDTYGHIAGDNFIKEGCKIICDAFPHSPVYRIGGDEFAVIIEGTDYSNLGFSMGYIEAKNNENRVSGGVTIAAGMAKGGDDLTIKQVFEQADKNMYKKKAQMKY